MVKLLQTVTILVIHLLSNYEADSFEKLVMQLVHHICLE